MTTDIVYRYRCDAPSCPAEQLGAGKGKEVPEGWKTVASTAHLAGWKPGQRLQSATTGRTHLDRRSSFDVHAGGFHLHLCPIHGDVFDAHLPQTEGDMLRPRERDRSVRVGCSCDWGGTWVRDLTMIHNRPEPRDTPERAWWGHLPVELQWYGHRKPAEVVSDGQ